MFRTTFKSIYSRLSGKYLKNSVSTAVGGIRHRQIKATYVPIHINRSIPGDKFHPDLVTEFLGCRPSRDGLYLSTISQHDFKFNDNMDFSSICVSVRHIRFLSSSMHTTLDGSAHANAMRLLQTGYTIVLK